MPKPKNGETKKEFIDRCMADSLMVSEYKNKDQRYAICNKLWDKKENDMGKLITDLYVNIHANEVRSAIDKHKTPISDKSWDGPKAKENLKNNRNAAYYRGAFTWVDPDVQASYKFIHHGVLFNIHYITLFNPCILSKNFSKDFTFYFNNWYFFK